jgi:hypothetical protein
LTCALLRLGQADVAEDHALSAAETVTGDDPSAVTWSGALTLITAIIAARRNDLHTTRTRLDQ